MSTKDPARGTPDNGENVTELEETDVTEPPNPTAKNDSVPKPEKQWLADKSLELEKTQNQETNS